MKSVQLPVVLLCSCGAVIAFHTPFNAQQRRLLLVNQASSGANGAGAAPSIYQKPKDFAPSRHPPMPGSDEDDPTARRSLSPQYAGSLRIPLLRAPERFATDDWISVLVSLPQSRILQRIMSHILFSIIWSMLVVVLEPFLMEYSLAPLSPTMHTLMGGMLSILLAFRMNQSYDRFWTAANSWEDAAGNIRNMALLLSTSLQGEEEGELVASIMRLLAAYPVALKQYLRGERRLQEFRGVLSKAEMASLRAAENMPLALCQKMSTLIAPLRLQDPNLYFFLQAPLRELILIIGECERIVRTPVPLSYVRHTSRFLSIFTLTLPFVLVGNMNIYLVPVAVGSVSWSLFAIEEIGHLIEEPFGAQQEDDVSPAAVSGAAGSSTSTQSPMWGWDTTITARPEILPLDRYCDMVRRDLTERYLLRRAAVEAAAAASAAASGASANGATAAGVTAAAAAAKAAAVGTGLVEV